MIAPEYFNNHVSVEGEIIIKSVPNDAGFVLVWNPTTKKISRRTHAEIATDLGLVTASNETFFNRNRIRSETISSVPVSLDAYLPQGGFISSYNTSSWGGSDRPINASYGGYIKFSDGNNDFNNLELYYNNGHNTPDTHRLWFRTKNNLGSTNWFEAYHSGNFNPDNYWEKYNSGWLGINSNDPRNFSFLTNDANIAKKINVGGLLVSDSYSNETFVPANGIWSKGNIQSNSRVVSSREGFFGAYDYTQTQGIWSIGESFNVNSNGSTTDLGNQYGIAYSYIDVGGSSFANVHQIHFASAGVAQVSIDCNYGRIKGREYQVIGGNSTQFLKADGSLDSANYAKSSELGYYHNIDFTGSITNGSNNHTNKTWFDYDWAGTGGKGSVINFSGLNGNYSTEIFSDYLSGNAIGVRTKNGDAGVWNDAKWIWHSGNFTQGDINNWNSAFNNQGNYVNKSGDTMTGDLNVPNIKSSNLNGGQLLTTAGTALYVSNQSVSTYLQTNGGLYHSTPAGVYDIWTAQNFNPNNYIPTSHPSYTISNNNINNWLGYLGYSDTRIIKPEHLSTQKLQFGFTSWNNQNNESVYADYLHFGGYQDASGGNQNLIVINKSVFGIRQYQGLFQETNAYSKFVDYWHSNNFSQQDIDNWNNTFNDQSNYWRKSSTAGYVGINANTPFSVLNNGYAQKVYMGGLLVSDAYQDEGNVPANGAYVKGQITTGSHGNSAEWKTAYNWGNHKEINTGQYLGNTGLYTIDSNTSVNSLPHGIASYFVQADSVYPSYGSLLNIKTYDGGGGTLQLYTPYSNQYGGDFIKYRRYNYGTDVWTEMRGFWDTGHFSLTDISNWNQAFSWGNHAYAGYLTQSALNSQLGSYATLNGVQTFTSTNTFLQSPVIPDGTINSHAVNLGQLYYNDRNFITDSRGAVRPPSFYDDRFAQWDFQHGNDTQVTGDAWQGVLTVAKWSNFDPSHRQEQLLFTGDNLKRRTAIDDDTWGPEKTIWDSGNFTPANFASTSQVNDKVNRSGDIMSGALNIASNHKIGDWRGTTQTGNYLSWLKYDGSKAIAYIGADGGSAIGNGGTGDNFVITSAGGGDLILSSSSGTIQANGQINTTNHGNSSQWQNTSQSALMNRGATFTSNVDADQISQGTEIISIELPNGSGNTNFPFHDYGTFMRFRANSFITDFAHAHNGNLWFKNFYIPNGAAGATWRRVWDNQNFNPDAYVLQSVLNNQLGNYATLNGVQTFTNTNTFLQSPVIPNASLSGHAVNLDQLNTKVAGYLPLTGGGLTGGGKIDQFGSITIQQASTYNATGVFWETMNDNDHLAGIGALTTGDTLHGVYMGWGPYPWTPQNSLSVATDYFRYKGYDVWHNGNFNPDSKVNKSGDTMTGALLIGNTNIGKQRVLHLAEPTFLDSYGFNFFTDTNTGLLTLHGLNHGLNNSAPILSASRVNNFVGVNKENPATELDVNGYVASNGFIKNNSSDDYFLMGGGGQLTKYSKDDSYVNSHRDFPDGTLITTSIDYSQSQGDSFLLEIKGNMYGGGMPMDTKVQGYIYADTIINQAGYSTYADLTGIIAMNINGNLCFWFPRLWYWQGFSVKVIATGGGDITTINRVTSIDNSPEPAGTKQVKIAIYTLSTQSWVNNQGFLTSANLNGYVTQSSLNSQLGNYATLNGVQTFNNTNTFNQSPVIPNGTLGNHAVNLNQLLDIAPPYHWNYVGQPAITNRRVLREMTWNNYGNGHTIFDISSGTTPWGASKSNVDAEQPWNPSYPTLVGGNGSGTYGVRVDSARNADNLGGIPAGNYATQTWVDSNYIPKSHPVFNITQANINSWNAAGGGGSSHTHSNLFYLNNIDQYLGTGQAPEFSSIRLMDILGYGLLALEEGYIGGEIGLVDTSNKRFYAGRINEYLKYGSSIDGFEGLNMHFDAQLLGIGREIANDEDKVQLAGDLSVDTIDFDHNSRQLILNPLYNTDGDVRRSRNAHIYIVTRNPVSLPDKPILGQRIEIFNDSDSYIEVTHSNVGTMFKIPGFCKVTGIAANKGFKFDAKPVDTKQYDI
ncbi:hypothetical protein [Chryseobacterium sp. YIM B08800]|uniref:hypothetical protein n=1 Tax=Chryseobacterium sp. YIM B08800 TaxID=2984136 RepID=UPI00224034C6|nr:hypothetical protein [Chryseobacterium sp. YIM B08800]